MKKAMVVILVLAVGVGGAMLFGKSPLQITTRPQPGGTPRAKAKETASGWRNADAPTQGVPLRPRREEGNGVDPGQTKPQRPTVLQPGARPPLPQLSDFDPGQRAAKRPPGAVRSAAENPLAAENPTATGNRKRSRPIPEQQVRYHTIVNGDTLERLARRYLGSSKWANALLQSNRNVIRDPTRLPLGLKIRIPPLAELKSDQAAASGGSKGQQEAAKNLVPLP
jgi:LysM repeat protein